MLLLIVGLGVVVSESSRIFYFVKSVNGNGKAVLLNYS